MLGLPVSGPKCKKIVNHHSLLTASKKLKRVQNKQLFLDLYEAGGTQEKLLPPRLERETGEYRESLPTSAETQEQKPP